MELSNEKYQEIVRHLSDGILIVDESGDILYESPAVQRITGYTPDERVGGQVFEHVHPDDQQQVRETFAEILKSEDDEIVTAEFRYRHKNGSWIWLETRGSNQTVAAIGGYVVSVSDITETRGCHRTVDMVFSNRSERDSTIGSTNSIDVTLV